MNVLKSGELEDKRAHFDVYPRRQRERMGRVDGYIYKIKSGGFAFNQLCVYD